MLCQSQRIDVTKKRMMTSYDLTIILSFVEVFFRLISKKQPHPLPKFYGSHSHICLEPQTTSNQFKVDVWPNNDFASEDLESFNWNNYLQMDVSGSDIHIYIYPGSPSRPNGLPLGRIGNPESMDHPEDHSLYILCLVDWTFRVFIYIGVSKNSGGYPKMDGFFSWKTLLNHGWFGGKHPLFLETPQT